MQLRINLLLLYRADYITFETIPILDTTHKQELANQIEVIVEQILTVKAKILLLRGCYFIPITVILSIAKDPPIVILNGQPINCKV